MSCRRCSRCGISYPHQAKYVKCPACGQETDTLADKQSDPDWKERAWAVFYEIHDGARQGPDPDEIGRREGREFNAELRALRELPEAA